ncbi:MAG: hypothetical protein J6P21_01295 [Clostridia bacterium]|nr:hypothetical protein [Clostridia bacterium]
MSHFRDGKKRIALAMGIASLFGAGKVSMAKGKPAGGTKVSAQKNFFSNMTVGKKVGLGIGGALFAGAMYETLADTAGKNTKMPSIAKAFGLVKGKQDDEKKDKDKDKDKEDDKTSEEICKGISNLALDYGKGKPDDKKLAKEFAIKILVETAKLADVTKETLKYQKNPKHAKNGGDNHKVYCFLAPIARKIGLSEERFSDDDIWYLCCHNFADAKKKVLACRVSNITEYEKGALMLISQLRNIMNYNAGCNKTSNYIEGDLLKALQELE